MAYCSGALAGAAFVQLDYVQKTAVDGYAVTFLAVTGLISIAVMLHVLGHVSRERQVIIETWLRAALFIFVGAIVAAVANAAFLGIGVAGVMVVTSIVARANWLLRGNVSKLRTASTTAGVSFAELLFLASLVLQHI
jgi:hypothetical protein